MSSTAKDAPPVTDLSPSDVRKMLDADEAVLIDVREPYEFAAEHISEAHTYPLSTFDPEALRSQFGEKRLIFQCRSGVRSRDAAGRFRRNGDPVHHLAGGIERWKSDGLPVERTSVAPRIDVMRQVQMAAGSFVLIGVLLGVLVSPWFLILSAFVGAGLTFAGATGWCGMAKLLSKMPWNRFPTPTAGGPAARRQG